MFDFLRALSLRPALDQWRDDHEMAALSVLNDAVVEVVRMLDDVVTKAGAGDALLRPQAFVVREVDPVMRAVVDPAVARLVSAADAEFHTIIKREFMYAQGIDRNMASTEPSSQWSDMLLTGALTAKGVAAAPAAIVPGAMTSVGLFGKASAGLAWATSLLDTARIKELAVERIRARSRMHVATAILGIDGRQLSMFEQIRQRLRVVAAETQEKAR